MHGLGIFESQSHVPVQLLGLLHADQVEFMLRSQLTAGGVAGLGVDAEGDGGSGGYEGQTGEVGGVGGSYEGHDEDQIDCGGELACHG
jgi:hypothetical protein